MFFTRSSSQKNDWQHEHSPHGGQNAKLPKGFLPHERFFPGNGAVRGCARISIMQNVDPPLNGYVLVHYETRKGSKGVASLAQKESARPCHLEENRDPADLFGCSRVPHRLGCCAGV